MSALSPTTLFRSSGGLISAQDLLGLMKTSGKSAFLRMRTFNSIVRTTRWKQRFIILANNEIYVYESEMSKRPEMCIPLFGYNQIKRYDSEKYPWSFVICGAVVSIKARIFSCATEEERRMWMRKIKEHLYKANNIERPFTDALNSLTSGTNEEYLDLEEPIFLPEDDKPEKGHPDFDEAEISDDEKSSDDEVLPKDKSRKLSTSSGSSGKIKVLPPVPASSQPPRYSAVVQDLGKHFKRQAHEVQEDEKEEEEAEEEDTYESETTQSRLERCLITDPKLERDRNACIALLEEKSRTGVYLLRKSRSDDSLVLSVLTDTTGVKEYRLEERGGLYRLRCKGGAAAAEFISLEALLAFFTHDAFVPGTTHFLTFGIFECPDDTYMDMQ